jgi:hypothetical protein
MEGTMSLCVNCKKYKKNAVIKVGPNRIVTKLADLCKAAAEAQDTLSNVDGKRFIADAEAVLCRNLNPTGTCPSYDEKSGGIDTPEDEIEIGGAD